MNMPITLKNPKWFMWFGGLKLITNIWGEGIPVTKDN